MRGDNLDIWKRVFLKYLDFDDSGKVDWWEYLVPITIILAIEVLAEIIAQLIVK
jgi:hypothetical protein